MPAQSLPALLDAAAKPGQLLSSPLPERAGLVHAHVGSRGNITPFLPKRTRVQTLISRGALPAAEGLPASLTRNSLPSCG